MATFPGENLKGSWISLSLLQSQWVCAVNNSGRLGMIAHDLQLSLFTTYFFKWHGMNPKGNSIRVLRNKAALALLLQNSQRSDQELDLRKSWKSQKWDLSSPNQNHFLEHLPFLLATSKCSQHLHFIQKLFSVKCITIERRAGFITEWHQR